MEQNKKPRKTKGKHMTAAEKADLIKRATKLITAKDRPMSVKQAAESLGVSAGKLYYYGLAAKPLREVAKTGKKLAA